MGDYEIRIKAIGGKDDEESDWSETYYFYRAYETGCLYRLVNNSEYEITAKGDFGEFKTITMNYPCAANPKTRPNTKNNKMNFVFFIFSLL